MADQPAPNTSPRARPRASGAEEGSAGGRAERLAAAAEVPADIRRSTWWWMRAAAVLLSIFLAVQLLGVVQSVMGAFLNVILYVLFGAMIAFIAGPVVDLLDARLRLPRSAGILLTLLGGLGLAVLLGFLIASPIVSEAAQISKQGPAVVARINDAFNSVQQQLASQGIKLGGNGVGGIISSDISGKVAGALVAVVTQTASILLNILVILVVAFWLLKDGDNLRAGFTSLLPGRVRSEAEFVLDAFGVVVGGYVRAQLFMALIIGLLAGGGSWLIGVPFPIVVGIAAAAFELIPLVGPFIGGAVALLLALTKSPVTALFVLILFVAIHIVEGYLLAPRIQARFVRLHPLITLLALFAGIEAGGFLGAFVAVPLASLVAVYIRAALGDARSRHPELFREQGRDQRVERRRRRILGEFRLFRREHP
jgi:predicted PurR-regulated permease PerM